MYPSTETLEVSDIIMLYYEETYLSNETYKYLKQVFNELIRRNDSHLCSRSTISITQNKRPINRKRNSIQLRIRCKPS